MAAPVLVNADIQTVLLTTAGTSIAVNKPTNLANDDIVYLGFKRPNTDALSAVTAPSGFTALASSPIDFTGNDAQTAGVWRKVITNASGEPSTYSFSWSGNERAALFSCRVTGADLTTPEDVTPSGQADQTGDFSVTCLSVTTVTADTLILAIAMIASKDNPNWTPPSGMTERVDTNTEGGGAPHEHAGVSLAEVNQASTGATGNKVFTSVTDDRDWHGFLVAVRPAADGGFNAVGVVTLPSLASTGAALTTYNAAGTPVMPQIAVGGFADTLYNADGQVTFSIVTVDGTANTVYTADGQVVFPMIVSGGLSDTDYTADGQVVLPSLSVNGIALTAYNADGQVTFPSLSINGLASGIESSIASGQPILPALTVSGLADTLYTADGQITFPSLAINGAAQTAYDGVGAFTLPSLTNTGIASVTYIADGQPVLPSLVSDGAVLITYEVNSDQNDQANGGFETGDLTSWITGLAVTTVGSSNPRTDTFHAITDGSDELGDPNVTAISSETLVPINVGDTLEFEAWASRNESDLPSHGLTIIIVWFNSDPAPISVAISNIIDKDTSGYQRINGQAIAPVNTASYLIAVVWSANTEIASGQWFVDDIVANDVNVTLPMLLVNGVADTEYSAIGTAIVSIIEVGGNANVLYDGIGAASFPMITTDGVAGVSGAFDAIGNVQFSVIDVNGVALTSYDAIGSTILPSLSIGGVSSGGGIEPDFAFTKPLTSEFTTIFTIQ